MVVQCYACTKHCGIVHCTGVILWDVQYTSVKKLTQQVGVSPMRKLCGHKEASVSQMLELTSDLGKHRGPPQRTASGGMN